MQALEKRVAALEQAGPASNDWVIVVKLVRPGHPDEAIHRLRSDDDERWERLPGESEDELVARARREVRRNEWGAARLITEESASPKLGQARGMPGKGTGAAVCRETRADCLARPPHLQADLLEHFLGKRPNFEGHT